MTACYAGEMDVLQPGTVFAGDFRIERAIHQGGLSTIYEVTQLSLAASAPAEARRALKVVHGDLGEDEKVRDAFLEEAKRASEVASVHVAQVFAWGLDEATRVPFVVLELLVGEPLAERAERGPMSRSELALFMGQLGHALAAAHDRGVIHRDLKPEGVVLAAALEASAPYRVEVQFVGVGKIASEVRENTTAAMSRPLWMAPEQAETNAKLSRATDVWTLGLFAFWLLTGRHYWKTARDMGSAMMTLMREILFEPLPSAEQRAAELGVAEALPPGFGAWFAKAVTRDPAARFQHAREAVDALMPLLAPIGARAAGLANAPPPGPGIARLPPPPPRAPAAVAAEQAKAAAQGSPSPAPAGDVKGSGAAAKARRPRASGTTRRWLLLGAAAFALVALGVGGVSLQRWREQVARDARRDADREEERKREAERDELRKEQKARDEWADTDCPIPVSYQDPTWGNRDAPVTLVVFTDLQCAPCAKLEKTLEPLSTALGKEKLRMVFKHAPSAAHTKGASAAVAAHAVFRSAGIDAFLKFKATAFAEQASLEDFQYPGWASLAGVKKSAEWSKLLVDPSTKKKVDDDVALAASLGLRAMPATFVNGVYVRGAPSLEKLRALVDEQAKRAEAERAKGTKPDQIYVTLTRAQYAPVHNEDLDSPKRRDDGTAVYKVPVDDAPALGPKDARATVVVFGDLFCPHSAALDRTLATLRDRQPDKLRVVWRDLPVSALHPLATSAASVGRAVRAEKGDSAFFGYVRAVFAAQQGLDEAGLVRLGKEAGASEAKLKDALKPDAFSVGLAIDQAHADRLDISSTPQLFLNGKRLIGAIPEDRLSALVSRAIEEGDAAVSRGVAPDAVYAELQKASVEDAVAARVVSPGVRPYGAPRKGALYGRLLVQEFCDLESPLCKAQREALDQVVVDRGADVELVFRFKLLDHHTYARDLANAGLHIRTNAGDDAFWSFAQKVFDKAGPGATFEPAAITELARAAYGVNYFDVYGFRNAVNNKEFDYQIALDEKAADDLGIERVPTLIVGKYLLEGPVSKKQLRRVIDKALREL